MEMCGRVWSKTRQSAAWADRFLFLGIFRTCSPAFPCLTVSFFLSFEIKRFQFFCLTSLFVCARARAFLFCSGWLLDFPSPFSLLSICHPLRKMHKHDECWLQGDFFVSCTVWRNESATLTQLCQNTSVRRLQVCFRGGSAAGGQQANSSSIPRRWRTRSWNPRSRMKTTRSSAPSLIADLKSHVKRQGKIAMCMPVCLDVERPLDLGRWDWTRNFPRRHSHREQKRSGDKINIRLNSCSFTLKERPDSDDMVRQKKFGQTTKVTCWWCRDADVLQSSRSRIRSTVCGRCNRVEVIPAWK